MPGLPLDAQGSASSIKASMAKMAAALSNSSSTVYADALLPARTRPALPAAYLNAAPQVSHSPPAPIPLISFVTAKKIYSPTAAANCAAHSNGNVSTRRPGARHYEQAELLLIGLAGSRDRIRAIADSIRSLFPSEDGDSGVDISTPSPPPPPNTPLVVNAGVWNVAPEEYRFTFTFLPVPNDKRGLMDLMVGSVADWEGEIDENVGAIGDGRYQSA